VAAFAIEIPEHRRVVGIGIIGDAQFLGAGFQLVGVLEGGAARHGDARKIAFHVGQEHRHPARGKLFGDALQRHRLAGAGRARDQPVPVGPAEPQHLPFAVGAEAKVDIVHVTVVPARKRPVPPRVYEQVAPGARGFCIRGGVPLKRAPPAMDQTPFILLDDARSDGASDARVYRDPLEIVVARRPEDVAPALARIGAEPGEWAGYIAYEAGLALEPRLMPLAAARTGATGPLVGSRASRRWRPFPPMRWRTGWSGTAQAPATLVRSIRKSRSAAMAARSIGCRRRSGRATSIRRT
jgi:hypothetical protein